MKQVILSNFTSTQPEVLEFKNIRKHRLPSKYTHTFTENGSRDFCHGLITEATVLKQHFERKWYKSPNIGREENGQRARGEMIIFMVLKLWDCINRQSLCSDRHGTWHLHGRHEAVWFWIAVAGRHQLEKLLPSCFTLGFLEASGLPLCEMEPWTKWMFCP